MASYRPSTLDLSLGSVTLFTTLRNPNSISQNRQTELPFSQSSPTSPPSSPLAPLPQPRGMSGTSRPDGHAAASSDMDFWGIEDITDTQWAVDPADEEEDEQGTREAIELEQDGLRIQAVQQRNLDRARREDPRKTKLAELKARRANRPVRSETPEDLIDLSSSSPKASSSRPDADDSQTPETALQPVTPHAGGSTPIPWSLSPENDENEPPVWLSGRKRKAHAIVLSEPDSEDENPLATSRRDKGKGRAPSPHEHSEAEIVRDFDPGDEEFGGEAVRDVEDEYDKALDDFGDFDFDFDFDLDKLNSNIATRHTSPLPNPRAPLAPIPPNHQSSFTDTLDQLSGLPMLHQLSDREQEFYKNHWRRGADRAEERREEYNVPARVQAAPKTNAVAKRGGFKARGSGRGRVRGRKR